jgi:hydrogenase maturation protease
MNKRILIAGIGNLLFTDEGLGVHILKELSKKKLPKKVELAEIGTATFELVRFIDGKDKVIIVDAIVSDEAPGTIYKLTPKELKSSSKNQLASLHQFGICEAIETVTQMGNTPEIVIFGVVLKDYQSIGTELTPELKKSIPKIIQEILKEIK